MAYAPLSVLKHVVNIGVPLPFDVLDSVGQLLLARGQVIESHSRLETLCARGSMVDLDDAKKRISRIEFATPQELPGLWVESMNSISRVLRSAQQPMFRVALDTAAKPVLELVARDPDLALFQIMMRGEYNIEGDEGDLSLTPAVAEARLRRRIRTLVSEELGRPKTSTLNSAPIVTERWQKLAGIIKG
jgi:hypothetical protein